MQEKSGSLLFLTLTLSLSLSLCSICLFSQVALGISEGAFVPLNFSELSATTREGAHEFSIIRFTFPSFSADLEVLIKKEPYVPVRALALYCGYQVVSEGETWTIGFSTETNRIYLENNLIDLRGIGVAVEGVFLPIRDEYYLSLSDFQLLTGSSALWNAASLEIKMYGFSKNKTTPGDEDFHQETAALDPNPFQPINRLSYLSNTTYTYSTPPEYDSFSTGLSWQTGGTIWGGQLTIGGLVDYDFDTRDLSAEINELLWEKETELGKWFIGTLSLTYATFYPYPWEVNGLAYATPDWRPLYLEKRPTLRGLAPSGFSVELFVDDLLYQTKTVENGVYELELWLVPRRSHKMRLLVKDGETVVEEKTWTYLPRDNYLPPKTSHFLTSIGFQEENYFNSYKNLFSSVSEWIIGFEASTLGLNLAAIDATDTSEKILQFSEISNWQLLSNLTFDTKAWYVSPDLGSAGRASLNLGLPNITFLTSYYYQPETFHPVFADCEEGQLEEYELGTFWQPRRDFLVHIRGSHQDRDFQDSTGEELTSHEAGLSLPLFSGSAMGLISETTQSSADHQESVNQRAEVNWSTGGFSDRVLELGWIGEKETSPAWPELEEEKTRFNNYWMELGLGLNSDRRYSIYLFSEFEKSRVASGSAGQQMDKSGENGLKLTMWQKNPDTSYLSLGMGYSERRKNARYWDKWSLNTSYYKEIIPETYLRISGVYAYEPDSPIGETTTYTISVQLDGGFSFTPYGILPGDNIGSVNDGQISGRVFLDENANGIMDEGEKGIPGIEVAIDKIALTVTDGQGRFIFHRISPGIRRIRINVYTLPIKYRAINDDMMLTVTAGSIQSINLGLEIVGSVSGRVYIDKNRNGLYDEKDQPQRGVKVCSSDGRHSTVTGQNGDYYLLLTPGTYRLELDTSSLPDDLQVTDNHITITEAAEEVLNIDFPLLEGETE